MLCNTLGWQVVRGQLFRGTGPLNIGRARSASATSPISAQATLTNIGPMLARCWLGFVHGGGELGWGPAVTAKYRSFASKVAPRMSASEFCEAQIGQAALASIFWRSRARRL